MKVVIRADSSWEIGSGHVMRCMTLASELRSRGCEVSFISRLHKGNIIELLKKDGFDIFELEALTVDGSKAPLELGDQSTWLGLSQEEDFSQCRDELQSKCPDWIIFDHYAIDRSWESLARPYARNIMVIDDLVNRYHDCDLLLDQNYRANNSNIYSDLIPSDAVQLLGPFYSLLREEFFVYSRFGRIRDGSVERVFIFFGGADVHNMTIKTLGILLEPEFSGLEIDVVVGISNNSIDQIKDLIKGRDNVTLHVQITDIARLMQRADFAVAAGGATTWERLAMGLPSAVISVADNQVHFCRELSEQGYVNYIGCAPNIPEVDIKKALISAMLNPQDLSRQTERGRQLVDGLGCQRVVDAMLDIGD